MGNLSLESNEINICQPQCNTKYSIYTISTYETTLPVGDVR